MVWYVGVQSASFFALALFHGHSNISDQYIQQPAKVSSQSQLLRVRMKLLLNYDCYFYFKPFWKVRLGI